MRRSLAALRLICLYSAACFLTLYINLSFREISQSDWESNTPLPSPTNQARPPTLLGITVDLADKPSAQRQRELADLKKAGFGWVRQPIDWGVIEPDAGHFSWEASDVLMKDLAASGMSPVIVLDGSPAWARAEVDRPPTDNRFAPPVDPRTFATFAQQFAQRYGSASSPTGGAQVRFYQLWDEPNIAPHWGNHLIDPVGYAQLLITASQAIRQVDSDAVILTAALAPTRDRGHSAMDEVYFLQRMIAAGAAPYFDAIAIQPIGFGDSPNDKRQSIQRLNFQRAAWIRRAMVKAGLGEKPIWAVRYGWNRQLNSPWATVSPENQHLFAVDALLFARAQWPWLVALGWVIDQPDAPPDDPVWGFALTERMRSAMGNAQSAGVDRLIAYTTDLPLFIVLFLFLIWRAYAALRFFPWRTWGRAFTQLPTFVQASIWGGLLLLYYFAVWPPLIVLCWMVGAWLMAIQPLVGVWLAVATLPFYFFHKEWQWVDTVWLIPPSLACTICLLPKLLQRIGKATDWSWDNQYLVGRLLPTKHSWSRDQSVAFPIRCSIWLALFWLLLSLFTLCPHPDSLRSLLEIGIQPIVLYLAVRLWVKDAQTQRQIVLALLFGGALTALSGIVDWASGGGVAVDGVRRLTGLFYSPNQTALYLLRSLFVAIGYLLDLHDSPLREGYIPIGDLRNQPSRKGFVVFAVGLILTIAIALLLTASRGALLLGVPAGLMILLLFWYPFHQGGERSSGKANFAEKLSRRTLPGRGCRKSLNLSVSQSLLLLLLLAGLLSITLYALWPRLSNSETLLNRLTLWQTSLRLWQAYSWFGVGLGGFFWHYPAFLPIGNVRESNLLHPHNVWLEFATTWGIFGLLWLFAFGIAIVRQIHHVLTTRPSPHVWLRLGLLAGLVASFAHGQVDAFMSLPELAAWSWVVVGGVESEVRSQESGVRADVD